MKPIIISADDFAQSAGIDNAIIALIEQGRLSATSCMTLSPRWSDAAKLITPEIRQKADIGLHLDFTQYAQTIRHSLPVLIARTLSHSLSTSKIRSAINAQLDSFEHELNTGPDYVDGHQHAHQLPQIRDVLLEVLGTRYKNQLPWIRIANPPVQDGFKARVIKGLGAAQLGKQAQIAGFRYSQHLLGVYAFEGVAEDYKKQLDAWLGMAKMTDGMSALMCHPALVDGPQDNNDPIYSARLNEYSVFNSEQFTQLMQKHQLSLARGQAITQ
ncbi:MAG TPA: ChbG/HpnK family deacetylase [Methylophilaceae bacterium]|nr:ChbG/HpnK family deacetylase [Methylophilaceae bacterium]